MAALRGDIRFRYLKQFFLVLVYYNSQELLFLGKSEYIVPETYKTYFSLILFFLWMPTAKSDKYKANTNKILPSQQEIQKNVCIIGEIHVTFLICFTIIFSSFYHAVTGYTSYFSMIYFSPRNEGTKKNQLLNFISSLILMD